jgi:hypothetical protein
MPSQLENIIVSDNFETKIMDYGSLKFTDQALQKVGPGGKANYSTKTPWQVCLFKFEYLFALSIAFEFEFAFAFCV